MSGTELDRRRGSGIGGILVLEAEPWLELPLPLQGHGPVSDEGTEHSSTYHHRQQSDLQEHESCSWCMITHVGEMPIHKKS